MTNLDAGARRPTAVILGAGPTGLGTSIGLALNGFDGDVVVVEKADRPGGLAGSFRWKEHSIDHGPHRLAPNLPHIRVLVEELLGPDCLINKSQHGVQFQGKLYQFPPRIVDWVTPSSFAHLCAFGASFVAAHFSWITWRFSPDTFETTMIRKFGRRFFERIARPMAAKVWIDPAEIDPGFVNQRFAQVQPWEVLKKVVFPRQELNPAIFYYPRRGFQQLWDSIDQYVRSFGHTVLYGSQAAGLDVDRGRIVRVRVRTPEGERVFEGPELTVVSTIPLASLVSIISGFPVDDARSWLPAVKVRSMQLVAFEFDQPRTLPYRTLVFPESDVCFNRLFEQNEYSRETVAPGRSVVVADITMSRGDPAMTAPDDEIVARVRRDLSRLPYVDCRKIADAHVERVEFAYVVPDLETRRTMYRIHHVLKGISNLVLMGRFATGEYDNSDYALDNGITVAQMMTGRSSRLDYLCALRAKRDRYILG
jgi:protoporphyrinogen oxidase